MITDLRYVRFEEIGSTHLYVREHWAEYEGTYAFIANKQTGGIGKGQHTWESPSGNLYVSLLVYSLGNTTLISLLTAAAIHQVILGLCPNRLVQLHWPNDVYIDGKKACGILLEVVDYDRLIISFGINTVTIPKGVSEIAEKIDYIDNERLFNKIINKFNELYTAFSADKSGLIEYWNKNVLGLHEHIVIKWRDTRVEGLFEQIDYGGRIVITCRDGEKKKISTGDMFVV